MQPWTSIESTLFSKGATGDILNGEWIGVIKMGLAPRAGRCQPRTDAEVELAQSRLAFSAIGRKHIHLCDL